MSATGKLTKFAPPYEDYPPEIPTFLTEAEEREFWATHEFTPYWDQFEDVTNNPPPNLSRRDLSEPTRARRRPDSEPMELIPLRLPVQMIESLMKIADDQDTNYYLLVKSWVIERTNDELAKLKGDD